MKLIAWKCSIISHFGEADFIQCGYNLMKYDAWILEAACCYSYSLFKKKKEVFFIVSFMSKSEKAWGNGDKANNIGYILKYSYAKKIKKSEVLYCFSGRYEPVTGNTVIMYRYGFETGSVKLTLESRRLKYAEIWRFIHSTVVHITST